MSARRLACAVAATLILAGCGHPSSGQVVAKDRRAPYSWTQMICSAYGKNGVCSVWVPIVHNEPECWRLTIGNGEDRWQVCTPKDQWDRTAVGASWREDGAS